jgi:hypothetical protein
MNIFQEVQYSCSKLCIFSVFKRDLGSYSIAVPTLVSYMSL